MMYLFATTAFIDHDLSLQLTLPLARNEGIVMGAALLLKTFILKNKPKLVK